MILPMIQFVIRTGVGKSSFTGITTLVFVFRVNLRKFDVGVCSKVK